MSNNTADANTTTVASIKSSGDDAASFAPIPRQARRKIDETVTIQAPPPLQTPPPTAAPRGSLTAEQADEMRRHIASNKQKKRGKKRSKKPHSASKTQSPLVAKVSKANLPTGRATSHLQSPWDTKTPSVYEAFRSSDNDNEPMSTPNRLLFHSSTPSLEPQGGPQPQRRQSTDGWSEFCASHNMSPPHKINRTVPEIIEKAENMIRRESGKRLGWNDLPSDSQGMMAWILNEKLDELFPSED